MARVGWGCCGLVCAVVLTACFSAPDLVGTDSSGSEGGSDGSGSTDDAVEPKPSASDGATSGESMSATESADPAESSGATEDTSDEAESQGNPSGGEDDDEGDGETTEGDGSCTAYICVSDPCGAQPNGCAVYSSFDNGFDEWDDLGSGRARAELQSPGANGSAFSAFVPDEGFIVRLWSIAAGATTVRAWLRLDEGTEAGPGVWLNGGIEDGVYFNAIELRLASDGLDVRSGDGSETIAVGDAPWHHVQVSLDFQQQRAELWIDGQAEGEYDFLYPIVQEDFFGLLVTGAYAGDGPGYIDEVYVF